MVAEVSVSTNTIPAYHLDNHTALDPVRLIFNANIAAVYATLGIPCIHCATFEH